MAVLNTANMKPALKVTLDTPQTSCRAAGFIPGYLSCGSVARQVPLVTSGEGGSSARISVRGLQKVTGLTHTLCFRNYGHNSCLSKSTKLS